MSRLLMVFLRGGADGLNIVIPAEDPGYVTARPTLGIDGGDTLTLDDVFGLHPAAAALHALWADGALAVVPAAGFPGQTRSHFTSQAELERGGGSPGTGWLGRHLAATAGPQPAPFRALAVGTVGLPPTLWGTGDALAAQDPTAIGLGTYQRSRARRGVTLVTSPLSPDPDVLAALWDDVDGVTADGADAALDVLTTVADDPIDAVSEPDAFGTGPEAAAFAAASAVVDAGLGTEIVMVDVGGWDTHDAQGDGPTGAFADLLGALDTALGEILARHDDLTALVVTEFGRRVAENASGGTDHGTGAVALVAGARVRGGVAGDWPGLATLADGDVPAVNDLRAVQAEIATEILATPDPDAVVAGASSSPHLDVIA